MDSILATAIMAAELAGTKIKHYFHNFDSVQIESKGRNDFVSKVDKEAEQIIIDTILKNFPNHQINAEESGIKANNSDYKWIIDPLDGTTNFLHQFPHFAVSIALSYKEELRYGVIYNPISQELFYAQKGKGAYLNHQAIQVSQHETLENALVCTGFPYYEFDYLEDYMNGLNLFMQQTAGVRRPGSAALDLAYVACGRVEGYWEFNLKPWDIAAGALIVTEAGGLATDFAKGEGFLESGNILAANPKFHQNMHQALSNVTKPELMA
jgi:myo-inositol-1(or 4)-monophosphatase